VTSRTYLGRIWVLMLTVFVDMMGFLIVVPLLPFYAERLGADPTRIGALVSVFALAQLATAPLWGKLSDRYGRRPVIMSGLAISAVSYVLFEEASAVWLLFASRIVQGAGAGTVGVVQAYVSDVVPPDRRSQAIGWLTSASSAGVMIGPAVASLAAWMGTIGPGYLAAGLCVFNLLFAWRNLPEPNPSARREKPPVKKSGLGPTSRALVDVVFHPTGRISALIWIYATGMMAFMAMNGVLALYLARRFGIDETTIGLFYMWVGGVSLIMRSLVLGKAVNRFGEIRLLRIGALTIASGMVLLPLAVNFWQLAVAASLVPIGTALLFPTETSLLSQRAAKGETGALLSVQQSVGGVARTVGPLWAGFVFQHIGIRSPFWIGAGLMVLASVFTVVVRDEGDGVEVAPSVVPDAPT